MSIIKSYWKTGELKLLFVLAMVLFSGGIVEGLAWLVGV